MPRPSRLTLPYLYALAVIAISVGAAWCSVIGPADFWWHLANGRTIVNTGALPVIDSFTYTQAGEPFFNQMWLAQVVMYGLYRAGGAAAVITAHGAVIGIAYGALLWFCIRLTHRPRLCSVVMLATVLPMSFVNWAVRPQPYAFPLFVLFTVVVLGHSVASDINPRRWLWSLPLVMGLWVNIHGSFALGLAMASIAAAVQFVRPVSGTAARSAVDRRRLYLAAAATWLATLANPRGYEVLVYVVRLVGNDSIKLVEEWQPASPAELAGALFFALAAITLGLMILGRRRPDAVEAALVIPFLLLGVIAIRNTLWFALLVTPILCLQLTAQLRQPAVAEGSAGLNRVFAGLLLILVIAVNPWLRPLWGEGQLAALVEDEPIGAVAYLAHHPDPPHRLFNDMSYGSYLPWALPEQKSFIDPRFELFPLEQALDYGLLIEGHEVERLTQQYGFDAFLIDRTVAPRLEAALERDGWVATYSDDEAAVFEPKS